MKRRKAMKKLAVIMAMCMVLAFAGFASAQICNVKELGSMLVFPLVDNTNGYSTIIDMANLDVLPMFLNCYAITEAGDGFLKQDFQIELTPKQVIWWDTGLPFDGGTFFVPSLADQKGFIFCWAVDDLITPVEVQKNVMKGDGLVFDDTGRAFAYNAYPFQMIAAPTVDNILSLDGSEYCQSPSRIYFEAFADGFAGITSTLVLNSLDNHFPESFQPELDLGYRCYNENEQVGSRQDHMQQFYSRTLAELNLGVPGIGTPKVQCQVDANFTAGQAPLVGPAPIVGITHSVTGGYQWGGLVWQDPGSAASTTITLWP
jgi:hypothetical protein